MQVYLKDKVILLVKSHCSSLNIAGLVHTFLKDSHSLMACSSKQPPYALFVQSRKTQLLYGGKQLDSRLLPDLEKLQFLLLAPEEGVFKNTFRRRPPRRLDAQHLLDEVSGYDVPW